jgi:hypothetical protein
MKQIILLSLISITVAFSSCKIGHHGRGIAGSGNRKTETRDLKSFKAIDTNGAYEVTINCQKPASFEIEADDNHLPLIKTEVRDGIRFVSSDESLNSSRAVRLRINLPEIDTVTSNGAGEIKLVDANGESLKLESLGAASIDASGKAKTLTVSSTGAGKIDTSKLIVERANVNVKGAASVDVYASEQLDVSVGGVGSVTYSGNPKVVHKNVTGIGSVSQK